MKNAYTYNTYLINLDRSADRLFSFTEIAKKHNLVFERISGVDGSCLPGSEIMSHNINNRYFRALSHGEVGCYLSHITALKKFIADNIPYGIILEDDTVFGDNFVDIIERAINDNVSENCWDILKLSAKKKGKIIFHQLTEKYRIVEFYPLTGGTQGQIWTRDAAISFVNSHLFCSRPVDVELRFAWEHRLRICTLEPELIHGNGASMIGIRGIKFPILKKWVYEVNFFARRFLFNLSRFGLTNSIKLERGAAIAIANVNT